MDQQPEPEYSSAILSGDGAVSWSGIWTRMVMREAKSSMMVQIAATDNPASARRRSVVLHDRNIEPPKNVFGEKLFEKLAKETVANHL
jgi:hypothetical protein